MGRAGPVRLIFVPFRDRGRVVGYPLDEFVVEKFNRSSLLGGFRGSTAMEMERMGRAGSVMLLFVPFRDGGCVVGYSL